MITDYQSNAYRISYQGVSMTENALENPNLIQVGVVPGCTIMVAPQKSYGIDYFPNGEYRSWTLTGYNTRLNRTEAHYIYARLDRESDDAMVLFSVNDYATDGSIGGENPSEDFYYIRIGSITATDSLEAATLDREITLDYGKLSTPEGQMQDTAGWKELFEVTADDLIRPLKRFTSFIVQGTLSIIGKLVINDKQITDVTRQGDEGNFVESDENLPTTKLLMGKYLDELRKRLLSKDREDQTEFLLKFGEFIDSMIAGKGAGIFPDGRGQFERLEVRGSMTVLDMIINQIQGMESDYSFAEIGKISYVEDLGDETYRLIIEKRTDFDFMKFQDNDVCFSIINTLLTGGSDYYTSWFRCLTKNVNDNTLTVVLYPDSEVPGGKNYPPVAGYNVTRRGNSVLPDEGEVNERAQSWLLSSREGRIMFLANVYKPILEDYNYALTIGKLPNIKALEKIPVTTNDVGVVSQIGIFERIYQFDYNGDVVPNKIDRGQWSLATAQGNTPYRRVTHETQTPAGSTYTLLEQHTVYHLGCKWGCLIDKTQLEPKWNSPAWEMLEGDKNYGMEFVSSRGWQFFRGQVNTDITAYITYSGMDITDDVMALEGLEIEWLRDSGNIPSDNSWKPTHIDGQLNTLRLTNDDMPPEWGYKVRTVMFICRIFIPVGGETQKIENYVGFNI